MPRLILSLLLLAAISCSLSALGAPPPATGQPVPAAVADPMKRGDKARKARRWAEALEAYRAALEEAQRAGIRPAERDAIAGEIGACEAALGKHREAAENLHRALVHREALGADRKDRFEQAFGKARDEIGVLYVGANPADAEVFVDGERVGAGTPTYVVFVEAGSHTVRARHAEHVEGRVTIDVAHGASSVVSLRMDRLPPCKACPAAAKAIPAAERRPPPAAAPRGKTRETLQRVGIVTAAGAAVVGAALTISAAVVDDNLEEDATALGLGACRGDPSTGACRDLQDAKDTRDLLHAMGIASLMASGAIGAATLISFQWAPAGRSGARVHAVPAVGPGRAGLVLTTTW